MTLLCSQPLALSLRRYYNRVDAYSRVAADCFRWKDGKCQFYVELERLSIMLSSVVRKCFRTVFLLSGTPLSRDFSLTEEPGSDKKELLSNPARQQAPSKSSPPPAAPNNNGGRHSPGQS